MSDNPFIDPPREPTLPVAAKPATPYSPPGSPGYSKKPSWLTLILVLTLILGAMGILGSGLVLIGPILNSAILDMVGDQGLTEDQMAARDELQELADKQFIPNLLFGLANLVVAPMLLVGAMGGLGRKSWTPKILIPAYLLAIVFVVLRTVYGLVVQLATKDQTLDLSMKNAGPQAEAMRPMIEGIFWVTMAMGMAYVLGLLIFYGLALMKMKSAEVEQYFDGT